AGAMAKDGQVFMLYPGEEQNIAEMAEDMICRAEKETGRKIEIIFTGMRDGEKISEDIIWNEDELEKTGEDRIYLCENAGFSADEYRLRLEKLIRAVEKGGDIKSALFAVVSAGEKA